MNVTIIGCGYVGRAVARYWGQKLGRVVTATTTSNQRVAELKEVAQHVVVTKGDNEVSLRSVIQNQYAVLLSVAPSGNQQVEAEIYEETYLRTAKNLVAAKAQQHNARVSNQKLKTAGYQFIHSHCLD
jgi:saccharopine dehydrogenase-like NADP-dependent oxidoreductase